MRSRLTETIPRTPRNSRKLRARQGPRGAEVSANVLSLPRGVKNQGFKWSRNLLNS